MRILRLHTNGSTHPSRKRGRQLSMSKQKENGECAGTQSEDRALSALPIRIEYYLPVEKHYSERIGDDFEFGPVSRMVNHYDPQLWKRAKRSFSLDPYAIRSAFDAIVDERSALRFLDNSGVFWPYRQVRLSHLFQWKNYFKYLRLPPEQTMANPQGSKAWLTCSGFQDLFFTNMPSIVSPADEKWMDREELKDRRREDMLIKQALRRFAFNPERLHGSVPNVGDVMSLEWHKVGDQTYMPCEPARQWKGEEHKPFLLVEVGNAVEAVAATIYADRISGVSYGVCKRCGKFFKVKSGHGQQFCPAPAWQKKSPCSNAFHAKATRDRAKAARDPREGAKAQRAKAL